MIAVNHDDSVQVIRHYNIRSDLHVLIMIAEIFQIQFSDSTDSRELNFAADYFTQDVSSLVCTDRDEIPSSCAVVPMTKAVGFDTVFILE